MADILSLASSTGNVQRTELEIEILKEEIAHLRAKDEEKTGVISYLEREREKDRDHYRSEAEMREEERDEDHLREKERAEEREREQRLFWEEEQKRNID